MLGMSNFKQVLNEETDTTVYSFNKLIGLLLNCNPNTIEMLGCKPEHYIVMTDIGQEFLARKKMFLSKRASYSFGGYAAQQLRRLENALARDSYPQAEKERHILNSCNSVLLDFASKYDNFEEGSIKLSVHESKEPNMDVEIFMDVNLTQYPLRDYKAVMAELSNVIKAYNNLNKRNRKKDDAHLNKHAMHLIRLYLMCLDILEKEEIITYREKDQNLLMSIRSGAFQKEDHTFRSEFFDMVNDFEKRIEYARNNTSLPEKPDYHTVEEFVMSVNERAIRGEY